ncbi:MAG: sulfite exporter TauE/SafE family protein [Alphaproteobacteria bacterium]|nr:sulfite exporter TauE/SafE family protein [Alphaproteobacteria bacterium]MBV8408262.1 sulfite exporter TauE/SafE family protein [Alphaproteobacteria bacterium]
MSMTMLAVLGLVAGSAAGLLAGLLGIGGGIVIVPVVYYGLVQSGVAPDQAAHVAVATSLAAIGPAAITSFLGHWRAGHADLSFLRDWGPGIAVGVVVAQFMAPHVRGAVLSGVFGLFCLVFAVRFAFPAYFKPFLATAPGGTFRIASALGIGAVSGFAGIGGGILTNIVMVVSGLPMHKSIGRAAAAGVVVSVPASIAAALASQAQNATAVGSIDLAIWICIAPAQAVGAWIGARLAARIEGDHLSRLLAVTLCGTGASMLYASWS